MRATVSTVLAQVKPYFSVNRGANAEPGGRGRASQQGAQEYLALLLLAARRGEARVEGAIRFLLGSQQSLNAEEAARLTEDNAPALVTTIAIDPVSLTAFDDLLTKEETAA